MTGLVSLRWWPQSNYHEVAINGVRVHVAPKPAELLAILLIAHPDIAIPRNELISRLWPELDQEPDTAAAALGVHIAVLRRAGIGIEGRQCFGWRIPREARRDCPPLLWRKAA